jgi:hypothetical protein
METILATGRFELTTHATREQAEAAVIAWLEKSRKR